MNIRRNLTHAGIALIVLGLLTFLPGCQSPAQKPVYSETNPIHAFRDMRPVWVDVLVKGAKPGTHREDIVAAIVNNMDFSIRKACDVADMILAGQKVDFRGHSHEQAAFMAEDLERIGLEVDLKVTE